MSTLTKINNSPVKTPKILVAPLDWGLGHATRCIPIIKELLKLKCEVWIAASGDQKALLEEEFPFLPFVELPGYNVKYGKNRAFTLLKILCSIPKILIRIKREKAWLGQFLVAERPDAVISDNRYGLHAPGLYSVFVTHQLRIRASLGPLADTLLQWIHYRAIRRFSGCWIPDLEEAGALAGTLSHPGKLPAIPTRYIGLLSRFEREPGMGAVDEAEGEAMHEGIDRDASAKDPETAAAGDREEAGIATGEGPCDLLILLSGPEPQRTIFETILLDQLTSYTGRTILVRGLPGAGVPPAISPGAGEAADTGKIREAKEAGGMRAGKRTALPARLRIYNHLPASTLNVIIRKAGIVLSRAGYSTIMDLSKLGKKAILVPTPGQTEQEYLGHYLSEKGMAVCVKQTGFSLQAAMEKAGSFGFIGLETDGSVAPVEGRQGIERSTAGMPAADGKHLLEEAVRALLRSIPAAT